MHLKLSSARSFLARSHCYASRTLLASQQLQPSQWATAAGDPRRLASDCAPRFTMLRRLLALYAILTCSCIPTAAFAQQAPSTSNQVLSPAKFVVFPVCVASHWYQSLSIVKQLSHRGHSVQVRHCAGSIVGMPCNEDVPCTFESPACCTRDPLQISPPALAFATAHRLQLRAMCYQQQSSCA